LTTLAVLQPGYLPWLGYFDQMRRADYFVIYDDVQFDKNGWRNRNRVKSATGPLWLTVPVLLKGLNKPTINQVKINNQVKWANKHIRSLQQLYAKAPYRDRYLPDLETLLNQEWQEIIDLDMALAAYLATCLEIDTPVIRASTLNIEGGQSERLLKICQHFQVDHYLSGNSAQDYLDAALFKENGVEVVWQDYECPQYPQLFPPFVSHLSTIDFLMNCGPDGAALLRNTARFGE
jgi:hypothetical protein